MTPPAPGRFSTVNCWPSAPDRPSARIRVATSVPPPAPNPTRIWTGFVGHSCAATAVTVAIVRAADRAMVRAIGIGSSLEAALSAASCQQKRASQRRQVGRLFFVLDRITQRSDSADLNLDGIAGFHPDRLGLTGVSDAGRRTGKKHVARFERHAFGEINERLG